MMGEYGEKGAGKKGKIRQQIASVERREGRRNVSVVQRVADIAKIALSQAYRKILQLYGPITRTSWRPCTAPDYAGSTASLFMTARISRIKPKEKPPF